jgi:hypothetical protein
MRRSLICSVSRSRIPPIPGRQSMAAVGTRISPRPPHRSRRALLTHRAPPSGQTSYDARSSVARRPTRSHYSDRFFASFPGALRVGSENETARAVGRCGVGRANNGWSDRASLCYLEATDQGASASLTNVGQVYRAIYHQRHSARRRRCEPTFASRTIGFKEPNRCDRRCSSDRQ